MMYSIDVSYQTLEESMAFVGGDNLFANRSLNNDLVLRDLLNDSFNRFLLNASTEELVTIPDMYPESIMDQVILAGLQVLIDIGIYNLAEFRAHSNVISDSPLYYQSLLFKPDTVKIIFAEW